MIIDPSALVAIIKRESDAPTFVKRLAQAIDENERVAISAAGFFELGLVVDRLKDEVLSRKVEDLVEAFHIVVIDVTRRDAEVARMANHRFGKGKHLAALNFGDCFSYALAHQTGEPLLFKGNDFSQTDVIPAV